MPLATYRRYRIKTLLKMLMFKYLVADNLTFSLTASHVLTFYYKLVLVYIHSYKLFRHCTTVDFNFVNPEIVFEKVHLDKGRGDLYELPFHILRQTKNYIIRDFDKYSLFLVSFGTCSQMILQYLPRSSVIKGA